MLATIFGLVALTCAIYGIPTGESSVAAAHAAIDNVEIAPKCERRPLRTSASAFNGTRTRHDFDDVLMIVFFNKPYYRVNIEGFNAAYSPYFKNVRTSFEPERPSRVILWNVYRCSLSALALKRVTPSLCTPRLSWIRSPTIAQDSRVVYVCLVFLHSLPPS